MVREVRASYHHGDLIARLDEKTKNGLWTRAAHYHCVGEAAREDLRSALRTSLPNWSSAPLRTEIQTNVEEIMSAAAANASLMWRNTGPFRLARSLTISMLCRFTRAANRPTTQRSSAKQSTLRSAHAYEQATGGHTRRA